MIGLAELPISWDEACAIIADGSVEEMAKLGRDSQQLKVYRDFMAKVSLPRQLLPMSRWELCHLMVSASQSRSKKNLPVLQISSRYPCLKGRAASILVRFSPIAAVVCPTSNAGTALS